MILRYRAYCKDDVIEIRKALPPHTTLVSQLLGIKAQQVSVQWFPKDNEHRFDWMQRFFARV
jgi:hypothetical protein